MGLSSVACGRLWRAPKCEEDPALSDRAHLVGYDESRFRQLDSLMFDVSPLSWSAHEAGDGILQADAPSPLAGGYDRLRRQQSAAGRVWQQVYPDLLLLPVSRSLP